MTITAEELEFVEHIQPLPVSCFLCAHCHIDPPYNYFHCDKRRWDYHDLWDVAMTTTELYESLHENLVVRAATCPDFERRK